MSDMIPSPSRSSRCILFDWGNTLMRDIPGYIGPMRSWPQVYAIPHAPDVLSSLRADWTLALATNAADSEEVDIWAALKRVGLDRLLDRVYCFRRIGHKKPSPQFFQFILDDLQLEPSNAVMVGDDFEADVLGANRAGIRAVWFNERSAESRTGVMFRTISDFRELPAVLRELMNADGQPPMKG